MKSASTDSKWSVLVRYHRFFAIAIGCTLQMSGVGSAQIRDTASSELIAQLGDKGVEKRRDAAYELARRGDDSDAVIEALGKATADEDTQVRVQSLTGLARCGKKAEPVMPALIKSLGNRDNQVRFRAASAIAAIGNSAIEPLLAHWPSASSESKIAAAQAFGILGPAAKSATGVLLAGLKDAGGLPRYAAEALVAIDPQNEVIVLTLANHTDAAARRIGISQLGSLGPLTDAARQKFNEAVVDSEPTIREAAIIAVAKSQMQMAEKAKLVESSLGDSAEPVREAAIVAMKKAALPAEQFSQRMIARLQTASIDSANSMIKAISLLGKDARAALPAMVQVVGREGIDQQLVSSSLASFGAGVVPDLLVAIEKNPDKEAVFSQALGLIGEPAKESLQQGLSSQTELVRLASVRALGAMRPMNKSVLQSVISTVDDKSLQVRELAVRSLITIAKEGDFSKDAALNESILRATKDPSAGVRAVAMQSLKILKFSDMQVTEIIDRGLRDESAEVRSGTLSILGDLNKFLRTRSDQLVEMVSDSDVGVRRSAAELLGKMDKKQLNASTAKACVKALGDSDSKVRLAATESVKALGIMDDIVLDALGRNLVEDLEVLPATLNALSGFGNKASSMLPAISRLISHDGVGIRVAALNAFSAVEKDSQQLVGRLLEALNDRDWEVRQSAGVALGKMGPDAKNAVPKLFGLLHSETDKAYADSALKEINTAPLEAIPLLMEKIDSGDRREAFYSVSLLGKIGPPAAESLPKLEAKLAKMKEEMAGGKPNGDKGRDDFRRKLLSESISAIKGESTPK